MHAATSMKPCTLFSRESSIWRQNAFGAKFSGSPDRIPFQLLRLQWTVTITVRHVTLKDSWDRKYALTLIDF